MKWLKKIRRGLSLWLRHAKRLSSSRLGWIPIALDMVYCKLHFRITEYEYLKYNFHNFSNRYRKHFVLLYHKRFQYKKTSTKNFTLSKYTFAQRIPDLFVRPMLLLSNCSREAFITFLRNQGKVVIKPDQGSLGANVEIMEYTDDASAGVAYDRFSQGEPMLCEAFIAQHETLQKLNPYSVNTVRIVTILYEGKAEVVAAILRTGAVKDCIVDNLRQGGIGAQVDIPTGIITTFGYDYSSHIYVNHPLSGVQFIGLQIPHWEQAVKCVLEAHSRLPQCKIYGWDIAFTPDGIDIIEANNSPGPLIMQIMDCIPKGQHLLKLLK